MYSRATIGVALALLIISITTVTASLSVVGNQNPEKTEGLRLPVIGRQLPPENGVIPVELKCEDAELSAPNALEKLSCAIKNNTNKSISAGTIYTSFVVEKGGETIVTSDYSTFYTYLHPDFREDQRNNFILPGGERRRNELPVSFESGVVIKDVIVQIDYIEFADDTALGTNRAGARIIADTREGAAKYKNWLAQKYAQGGRSVDAIIPLLEDNQPLPEGLEFQNAAQQSGANMYRKFARRTYQTKGAEGLIRHLEKDSTSANR